MSVNNYSLIRDLLEFRSEDDFYFLQILRRKKDHKDGKVSGSNNNSRLIKYYLVSSVEYFDFIEPEVIELCDLLNARAGINLNRRSFEKMALQNLKKVTDQILNKTFNKAHKAYSSVCGAYNHDGDKTWIIDIDREDHTDTSIPFRSLVDRISSTICMMNPVGEKEIAVIPSRTGYHLLCKPFNLGEAKKSGFKYEVHKNNPTNLYIP